MADAPIVHIGENSPEQVAFKLMEIIAKGAGETLTNSALGTAPTVDAKWLLDTYAECLRTVRDPQGRGSIETITADMTPKEAAEAYERTIKGG